MIACPCCHDEPPWQLNGTADTRPDTRLAFMDSAACIRSHRGTGAMAGFSMEGQADGGGGVATCSAVGERAVRVRGNDTLMPAAANSPLHRGPRHAARRLGRIRQTPTTCGAGCDLIRVADIERVPLSRVAR